MILDLPFFFSEITFKCGFVEADLLCPKLHTYPYDRNFQRDLVSSVQYQNIQDSFSFVQNERSIVMISDYKNNKGLFKKWKCLQVEIIWNPI